MNTVWIVALSIVAVGLFIFLFLTFKAVRKHKAIRKYEELREKLSVREAEEETGITEEEAESYGGFSLGNIVGGFITIVIGVSLVPIISKEINLANSTNIVSPTNSTILKLVPIFFVIAIVGIAIGIASSSLRKSGLI